MDGCLLRADHRCDRARLLWRPLAVKVSDPRATEAVDPREGQAVSPRHDVARPVVAEVGNRHIVYASAAYLSDSVMVFLRRPAGHPGLRPPAPAIADGPGHPRVSATRLSSRMSGRVEGLERRENHELIAEAAGRNGRAGVGASSRGGEKTSSRCRPGSRPPPPCAASTPCAGLQHSRPDAREPLQHACTPGSRLEVCQDDLVGVLHVVEEQ